MYMEKQKQKQIKFDSCAFNCILKLKVNRLTALAKTQGTFSYILAIFVNIQMDKKEMVNIQQE